MPVEKWDPFRDVNALQDRVNRMFEEIFPRAAEREDISICAWTPLVDIYHTDEGIAITVDLPGVAKEEVSVEVKNNVLTLKGRRKMNQDIGKERDLGRGRCFGTFHPSFTLKSVVPPDKVKATFKNGVLTIQLPLPEYEGTRQIKVNVD